MVEQINIQNKRTVASTVILAIFGMAFLGLMILLFKKISLRNSYTGSTFWGIIFFLEGIALILLGAVAEELESSAYWVFFFFFFLPLIIISIGLIGGKGNQDEYLKDIDTLLTFLVKNKVFSLQKLEKSVPKNNYAKYLKDSHIVYMLNDLAACNVLSFQRIDDRITVNILLPAFKTMQFNTSYICPNCGAEFSRNVNTNGDCICEYCGTLLEE